MASDTCGSRMYMASTGYMDTYAAHLVRTGARVVGGCCGTTPEHIKAMVEGVRPLAPRVASAERTASEVRRSKSDGERQTSNVRPQTQSISLEQRSKWGAKIATNQFVTSVEIVPPRGVDASRMITDVRKLKDAGVDAVNVPDGPRAQSRM